MWLEKEGVSSCCDEHPLSIGRNFCRFDLGGSLFGLIRADASVGLIQADLPAGLIQADLPAGLIQADLSAGLIQADFPAGLIQVDLPAGLIQANLSAGLIQADLSAGLIQVDLPARPIRADKMAEFPRISVRRFFRADKMRTNQKRAVTLANILHHNSDLSQVYDAVLICAGLVQQPRSRSFPMIQKVSAKPPDSVRQK